MSFRVTNAVYSHAVGGFKGKVEGKALSSSAAVRKAVLAFMADKANDDGSGVWCSKATIAANTELALGAVRNAIKSLVADEILVEIGQRPCSTGYTWEYAIALDVVAKLDLITPDKPHPVKSEGVHEEEGTPSPDVPKPPLTPPCDIPSGISSVDFDRAFDAYQRVAAKVGWPKVVRLTPSRRKLLTARLNEHGLAAWGDVLRKAAKSDLCTGQKNGWRASFDFLIKKANFIKVLEGNYDNTKPPKTPGPAGPAPTRPGRETNGFGKILAGIDPEFSREGDPGGGGGENEPFTIDGGFERVS